MFGPVEKTSKRKGPRLPSLFKASASRKSPTKAVTRRSETPREPVDGRRPPPMAKSTMELSMRRLQLGGETVSGLTCATPAPRLQRGQTVASLKTSPGAASEEEEEPLTPTHLRSWAQFLKGGMCKHAEAARLADLAKGHKFSPGRFSDESPGDVPRRIERLAELREGGRLSEASTRNLRASLLEVRAVPHTRDLPPVASASRRPRAKEGRKEGSSERRSERCLPTCR